MGDLPNKKKTENEGSKAHSKECEGSKAHSKEWSRAQRRTRKENDGSKAHSKRKRWLKGMLKK
jgi:hypothetical protein